jgi:hypothetical protein
MLVVMVQAGASTGAAPSAAIAGWAARMIPVAAKAIDEMNTFPSIISTPLRIEFDGLAEQTIYESIISRSNTALAIT